MALLSPINHVHYGGLAGSIEDDLKRELISCASDKILRAATRIILIILDTDRW